MRKTRGASRNLTNRYIQLINEETDRRKSQNDSKGEMLDKVKASK